MKTLAVISQKGGAGKTTLAIHLAVAAEMAGKQTALIDIDPQASAASWGDSREKPTPAVVSTQPSRLDKVLAAACTTGADLVIIDTAPHELVKLAGKRASVILNTVPPRGNLVLDATTAVATYGVPVCPVHIGQRAAFIHSLTSGLTAQEYEPGGKASEEINRLYLWTCKQLDM